MVLVSFETITSSPSKEKPSCKILSRMPVSSLIFGNAFSSHGDFSLSSPSLRRLMYEIAALTRVPENIAFAFSLGIPDDTRRT